MGPTADGEITIHCLRGTVFLVIRTRRDNSGGAGRGPTVKTQSCEMVVTRQQ